MALNLQREVDLYSAFMTEIKERATIAIRIINSLPNGSADRAHFIQGESAILQTRMVCELIALSALAAHNAFGLSKDLLKSWNADKTFRMLARLHPRSFPVALKDIGGGPNGMPHYQRDFSAMPKERLAKIYEDCGELLHRGALRKVMATNNNRQLNMDSIGAALQQITRFLNVHAILIPEQKLIFVTHMNDMNTPVSVGVATGGHFPPQPPTPSESRPGRK